jgi:hypothetical protein
MQDVQMSRSLNKKKKKKENFENVEISKNVALNSCCCCCRERVVYNKLKLLKVGICSTLLPVAKKLSVIITNV